MKKGAFLVVLLKTTLFFAQDGLIGEYFNGINFEEKVMTRTDAKIDFGWWQESPKKGVVNNEYYSVRWTGKLLAPETGKYQFSAKFDDGIRLWVNNVPLINAWSLHNMGDFSNFVTLEKGKTYPIKLEFFNAMREGEIQLLWKTPSMLSSWLGTAYSTVPAQYFYKPDVQPVILADVVKPKPTISAKSIPNTANTKPKSQNTKAATPSVEKAKTGEKPISAFDKMDNDLTVKQVFFIKSINKMTDNSMERLDKVVAFLKSKPTAKIELKGHTDVLGDAEKNMELSVSRAKVVAEYLIGKGVQENRITYQGYGSTHPLIAGPKTEEERALNRRVEFVIIK